MRTKQSAIERYIRNLKSALDLIPATQSELEARADKPELSISSLPDLNFKIWGLKPKGLTIIGGRTSQGKSSLALQMAYDLADQGNEVVFLSLEMTVESLLERLFCNLLHIDNNKLQRGVFKVEYQNQWQTFKKMLNIPLKLSSGLGKTLEDINVMVQLLNPKPKAIFIDHIQGIRKGYNERRDMDDYLLEFNELCITNNIAGVVVSQNSRKVFDDESKEPTLANLKGTGVLEELATTVLLVFWPHFYNENLDRNIYKIIIAKQRNGRTGYHLVNYIPENYRFTELTLEQKENLNRNKDRVEKTKQVFEAREIDGLQ
jgi:replicative DNA helicase